MGMQEQAVEKFVAMLDTKKTGYFPPEGEDVPRERVSVRKLHEIPRLV
jgi:hypothetical protein